MKQTFPYDMNEVNQLAIERGISISCAKYIIYQKAYYKNYYETHHAERKQYFKEYRKLIKYLKGKRRDKTNIWERRV